NLNNILKAIEKYNTSSELLKDNTIFTVDKIELERRLSGNVYGRRFTRYVLLKYEYLLGDNTVHLSNYKTISVEHVLPQNPKLDSFWINDFNALEREEWTHKLSNLVLINMKKNSKLGNLDFERKKERYLKGRIDIFPSNKIFQNYTNWDVNTLIIRQKMMIESLIK
ncbi:HNH endonuclease family protein, partial [Tenacibaculum maritimum]